jgi:hypothetical protein
MKKSILIFCAALATFSLMALGYVNTIHSEADRKCNSEREKLVVVDAFKTSMDKLVFRELYYDVNSRFIATVTKEDVVNAKSIIDILPEKATYSNVSYRNVKVTILSEENVEGERSEGGEDEMLNDAQTKLLQSIEYSNNIFIYADYQSKNEYTGEIVSNYMTYYISVIPEKEAEFKNGHEKLIEYIKSYNQEKTKSIGQDQVKPGRVKFTITDRGEITDITLTSTSGHDSIDESMIKMVASLQGEWEPAKNLKGENVNQELILFFGNAGC